MGAEPEPDLYIAHLLEVFAEVKRVLRKDGVCWLNIGDSYSAGGGAHGDSSVLKSGNRSVVKPQSETSHKVQGMPPKSLCLIPERLALGLLGQGWIIRNRVVWHKPNAMPTSARDRFKCCWETVFLLVKQQRYKFRLEAVKQPPAPASVERVQYGYTPKKAWRFGPDSPNEWPECKPAFPDDGCNPGDVWRIASQPRSENHFAAFPDDLVKRCLLASTKPGDEVLHPFVGRGTTVIVAKQLGRRAVGIELTPTYAALAEANIRKEASQEVMPT